MKSEIIIFYDGICILCSNTINFVLKNDQKNLFLFSPLQSSYAIKTVDKRLIEEMNTVVIMKDGNFFTNSKAAFIVLDALNHPLRYFKFIVPTFIADIVYKFIARKRYSWFGKKEECIFPVGDSKFLID